MHNCRYILLVGSNILQAQIDWVAAKYPLAIIDTIEHPDSDNDFFNTLKAYLHGVDSVNIILTDFGQYERLPQRWILSLATHSVTAIDRLIPNQDNISEQSSTFYLSPHRPLLNRKADILVVFSGSLLPVMMGARQRVTRIIEMLSYSDVGVELLTTDIRDPGQRPLLLQLCVTIHEYEDKRDILPHRYKIRELITNLVSEKSGSQNKLTYSEFKRDTVYY
jgi:hypothetical protein